MQSYNYLTIAQQSTAIYTAKSSKFIAVAYPFSDKNNLKTILELQRKQHYKARHFCYAYKIGTQVDNFRINDDGEPSGSAGLPILGQINSKNLTDVLVVVIRYFGGTLLGVPGLIKAYKSATAQALANAEIIEKYVGKNYLVELDYKYLDEFMHMVQIYQTTILHKKLQHNCLIEINIPINHEKAWLTYLINRQFKYKLQ